MATVKHSDKFKDADLVKQNESLKKIADGWRVYHPSYPEHKDVTVADIKANPGFYIKDTYKGRVEWRGPFKTEQEAKDWHAEMAWERKHS